MISELAQLAAIRACGVSRRLPRFRGRDRAALALLEWAGLTREERRVRATMRHPTRFEMELNLGSWMERLAFVSGGYESELPIFLSRLWASHPSAGCCVDVGANVGLIAIPLARLLATGRTEVPRILAVEPVRANAEALRTNLALNRLGDLVAVLQVAAGESDASAVIEVEGGRREGEHTGTASILPVGRGRESLALRVEVRRLDDLVRASGLGDGCAVVKLDTDGYDLFALMGARELLRRSRPFVFGEFDARMLGWHAHSHADVLQLAAGLGYEVLGRQRGAGFRFEQLPSEGVRQDLLLVPGELRGRVEWCRG